MRFTTSACGASLARPAIVHGTNAWSLVEPIVEVAVRAGLDRRTTMQRLGSASRVPIERVFALWADCARVTDDIAVPIRVGQHVRLEMLDLMGLAVLTAQDGHAALAQAIRYAPLITDSGRWSLEDDGELVTIHWSREGDRWLGHRLANEAGLVQFVACLRQLCGARFAPTRVQLRHRAPRRASPHRDHFRCPVEFAADGDSFTFERRALDVAAPAANPAVAAFVREHADAQLGAFASTTTRVRVAIEQMLQAGDRPSINRAALEMGASERTLRRRLAAEHTSWAVLLDDILRGRARTLVTQTNRPLIAIALELGFSDASAFSHAYRRWFGCSARHARAA